MALQGRFTRMEHLQQKTANFVGKIQIIGNTTRKKMLILFLNAGGKALHLQRNLEW